MKKKIEAVMAHRHCVNCKHEVCWFDSHSIGINIYHACKVPPLITQYFGQKVGKVLSVLTESLRRVGRGAKTTEKKLVS